MTESTELKAQNYTERAESLTTEIVNNLLHKHTGWEMIYRKLLEVKENSLYQHLGISSFTKYVQYLASQANCQVSYIWRTWDAGRYFTELTKSYSGSLFKEELEENGQIIGDEVITDVRRISGRDGDRALTILRKFAAGELTKSDIKALKRASRSTVEEEALSQEINLPVCKEIHADDILISITSETFGLYKKWMDRSGKDKFHLPKGNRSVFEIFPDFAVPSPGDSKLHKIDALVVSNLDTGKYGAGQYEVSSRAIIIKTSIDALRSDYTLHQVAPFVNECSLAVPIDIEEAALQYLPSGWGLLIYDPDTKETRCKREGHYIQSPPLLLKTLQTLAVKKLQAKDYYSM